MSDLFGPPRFLRPFDQYRIFKNTTSVFLVAAWRSSPEKCRVLQIRQVRGTPNSPATSARPQPRTHPAPSTFPADPTPALELTGGERCIHTKLLDTYLAQLLKLPSVAAAEFPEELSPAAGGEAIGVLGFARMRHGYSLAVVTKAKRAGRVGVHEVWRLVKTQLIPLFRDADYAPGAGDEEQKCLGVLAQILPKEHFF